MLNDQSVMDAAEATARRLLSEEEREDPAQLIDRLFELMFSARPSEDEREELVTFARETREKLVADGDEDADVRAWAVVCQALFASSRFHVIE